MLRNTVIVVVTLLTICTIPSTARPQLFNHQQALADLRFFVDALEQTHPDPYSAYGGKVAFRLAVQNLIDRLPPTEMTAHELYSRLRPFVAQLSDLHTSIQPPESDRATVEQRYSPLLYAVADDAIYVSDAKQGWEDYLGHRLDAVNGIGIDDLLLQSQKLWASENEYGARRGLSRAIRYLTRLNEVFDSVGADLALTLTGPGGKQYRTEVPLLSREDYGAREWVSAPDSLALKTGKLMSHRFLDDAESIAYLWLPSLVTREAFEFMRSAGDANLASYLKDTYENSMGEPVPSNIDEAISRLPSLASTVHDLLVRMRETQARYLIVDLRRNTGGWSVAIDPMLYMLYGDDFFATEFPVQWVYNVSQFYLDKFSTDIASFNQENATDLRVGDFYFKPGRPHQSAVAHRKTYLQELQDDSLPFHVLLDAIDGKPVYSPRVIVVTSPQTGSSAYHLLYYLWRMGATAVGVPPGQAGNAFMDATPIVLPNSGIHCQISHSAVVMFPDDPERGRTFIPDYTVSWADFVRFGFDANAEIRYILELIRTGKL